MRSNLQAAALPGPMRHRSCGVLCPASAIGEAAANFCQLFLTLKDQDISAC